MSNLERENTLDGEDPDTDLEPEIQKELDHLNQCSAEINRLENEVDEARTKYRQTFHEASSQMSLVSQKRRKSIAKAREYFVLKEEAKMVQGESLRAARQYQSAIGIYKAAKETVALAEDRLVKGGEVQLSSAWQEMLNHATTRVMEAEKEKRRSEEQHLKMTQRCQQLAQRLIVLERTKKRSIANARPYFELKQQLDLKLQQQKQNITDLQSAIKQAKTKYATALRKLEEISLAIHEARRNKLLLMYPRQPGVGAECDSLCTSLSELSMDSLGKDCEDPTSTVDNDDESYFEGDPMRSDSGDECSSLDCKVDKTDETRDEDESRTKENIDNESVHSESKLIVQSNCLNRNDLLMLDNKLNNSDGTYNEVDDSSDKLNSEERLNKSKTVQPN